MRVVYIWKYTRIMNRVIKLAKIKKRKNRTAQGLKNYPTHCGWLVRLQLIAFQLHYFPQNYFLHNFTHTQTHTLHILISNHLIN